jgi:hypothetical protein
MRLIVIFLLFFAFGVKSHPKDKFYPDGYYFTKMAIKNKDWNFQWLFIGIKPTKDLKNSVSARFLNSKTQKWFEIETKDYYISHDSSIINFNSTLIGSLTFQGHFTYSKPPFGDRAVKSMETIVFIGSFKFKNKILPIEFTWWEGD